MLEIGAKRKASNIDFSLVIGEVDGESISEHPFADEIDWLRQYVPTAEAAGYYLVCGDELCPGQIWHGRRNDIGAMFRLVYLDGEPAAKSKAFVAQLTELTETEPGYVTGVITLFNVEHFAEFIRVRRSNTGTITAWAAVSDPQMQFMPRRARKYIETFNSRRLARVAEYDDCAWQTVRLPGRPGEYVLVVTPCEAGE